MKALLTNWRAAAFKRRQPTTPVPPIFAGRVANAVLNDMWHERIALAEELLRAISLTGTDGDARDQRRGLDAVGQFYGLLGPPREKIADIRVRADTRRLRPSEIEWLQPRRLRQLMTRAYEALAESVTVPTVPEDYTGSGRHYPWMTTRRPTESEQDDEANLDQSGRIGGLRVFDIKAALGLFDNTFNADLIDQIAGVELASRDGSSQAASDPQRGKYVLRFVMSLVPADEVKTWAMTYSLPLSLDTMDDLPNDLRMLLDRALQYEVDLTSGEVARLLHAAEQRNGLHDFRPGEARLLFHAALRIISIARITGKKSRVLPPQAAPQYNQASLGLWGELEVRALRGFLQLLRVEEDSGAFVVARRLLAILPPNDWRRLPTHMDRLIVATGHRMFRYADAQLERLRADYGDVRRAVGVRDAAEWQQQIKLVEASVPVRRLRAGTSGPREASQDLLAATRAAAESWSQAARMGMPDDWRVAAARRQAEPLAALNATKLEMLDPSGDLYKAALKQLDRERHVALAGHPEFALNFLRVDARLALTARSIDARDRFNQALEQMGEYGEQFGRIPRWTVDLHAMGQTASERWGDGWEPPIGLPPLPEAFTHRQPPHHVRRLALLRAHG
ncbi:MAG: hypothetical protein WD250_15195 [Egibacteraceae bacterium]